MGNNRLLLSLLLLVAMPSFCAHACAIFSLHRDGQALMGNNEDYIKPGAIWFERGRGSAYGRVNVGFYDKFAQGSMNEKGLAFDAATLPELPWEEDPAKETPKNLIEKIMDECASVEEALAYFERYNCRHLSGGQFFFADASGAAAIVSWVPGKGVTVTRPEGDYLIATNTRLEVSGYRCQRHVRASQVLDGEDGTPQEVSAAALEAIHQHGPGAYTSYSTIYDLQNRTVTVYNLADFSASRTFQLDEELARKRSQFIKLSELFPEGPDVAHLSSQEQRMTWDTAVSLSNEELAAYEGIYSPEEGIEVRISRNDAGGLTVSHEGQPDAQLVFEGKGRFRIAPDRGLVTFHGNEQGETTHAMLHKQVDVRMERLGGLE